MEYIIMAGLLLCGLGIIGKILIYRKKNAAGMNEFKLLKRTMEYDIKQLERSIKERKKEIRKSA